MHLKEAASIRDTALRAMDETDESDPDRSPHGKALWMHAKSLASGPSIDRASLAVPKGARGSTPGPGLVSSR